MNRLLLAAPLAVLALAGCAAVVPMAAPSATPSQTPAATPAATVPAATSSPSFPAGPICEAFTLDLAVWQAAGANGTATWATFRKFAKQLRTEAVLAADDQPLGADLSSAAKAVYRAGRSAKNGGHPDTTQLADDLESVKIDCGTP